MSRPFSCTSSQTLKCSGEIDRLSFPFIDLYVPPLTPRLRCSEAALQFAEHTTFMFLCRVNTGNFTEKKENEFQVPRGYHSYIDCSVCLPVWGGPESLGVFVSSP
jgi:hypothetical protein